MGGGGAGATPRGSARGTGLRSPPGLGWPKAPHARLEAPAHLRKPLVSRAAPGSARCSHVRTCTLAPWPDAGRRAALRTCASRRLAQPDALACAMPPQTPRRGKSRRGCCKQPVIGASPGFYPSAWLTTTFALWSQSDIALRPQVPTPLLCPHSLLLKKSSIFPLSWVSHLLVSCVLLSSVRTASTHTVFFTFIIVLSS